MSYQRKARNQTKKLDHVMDKYKQEQNDPTLLAVGQSMSASKKGPLGRAGLLDT